jgi:hypothetical protein
VVVVAVLLLPLVSLMLVVMDRVEDRLLHPAESSPRRHGPRRPQLRLIRGGRHGVLDTAPAVTAAVTVEATGGQQAA